MTARPSLLHELLDHAAATVPRTAGLSTRERAVPFREVAARSRALAHRLRKLGVQKGDRVLIRTADPVFGVEALFAVSRVGAVFSVLHEEVSRGALDHVLEDAEPRLMIADDGPEWRDLAERRGVGTFAVDDGLTEPVFPDRTDEEGLLLETDPVCMIYTSGTTSRPKAVVCTHQNMLFATRAIQDRLRYQQTDTVFCALPISFDYGLYQVFLAISAGSHLRFATSVESGPPLLRTLIASGTTVLAGVPALSDRLAWLTAQARSLPERLRLLTNTGAALSEKTVVSLRERLPGLSIQLMYGLTECKRATIMPPDGDRDKPGSCGPPLAGTEIFTVDQAGVRLPAGRTGQIVVRGPHVMLGYWRRPDLTATRFPRRDGLFPELHTGDYGWVDTDGYLYFDGRKDDIYKERGFRVSAAEVEAAAHRVEGVMSAVVLPPAEGRPARLAVVSTIPEREVLSRMRAEIESHKIPRTCTIFADLPTNNNGKVDRSRLTDLISQKQIH